MKNNIYKLFIVLFVIFFTISCDNKDEEIKSNMIAPISLSLENNNIEINVSNVYNDVLILSWSDESKYIDKMSYQLELKIADNDDSNNSIIIKDIFENKITITGEELQKYILDVWGKKAEEKYTISAIVSAVIDQKVINISNNILFYVKTYSICQQLDLNIFPLYVTLNKENEDGEVLKLNWTKCADESADNYIVLKLLTNENICETKAPAYDFCFKANIDYNKSYLDTLRVSENTLSIKTNYLNSLLTETWKQVPNNVATISFRVESCKSDKVIAKSDIVNVDLIPYGKPIIYTDIALVGTAVQNKENIKEPLVMIHDENNPSAFYWEGNIREGNLFITCNPNNSELGDILMASVNDKEIESNISESMILLSKEYTNREINKWKIKTGGKYRISVNTEKRTIFLKLLQAYYDVLSIVGPATPNGWDIKNTTQLKINNNIFSISTQLTAGDLRFVCNPSGSWDDDQLIAEVSNTYVESGHIYNYKLSSIKDAYREDYMWNIVTPGEWTINVDLLNENVEFVRTKGISSLYLVGSASPNGWDDNNMLPMNAENDNNKWSWTGNLKSGELKFICNRNDNLKWGSFQIYANINDELVSPTSSKKKYSYSTTDDNKYFINTPGKYKIDIDIVKQTVDFLLLENDVISEKYPSLGLIGSAAPQGWGFDYSKSILLQSSEAGCYSWTGYLSEGDLNIFCDINDNNWNSPRLTAVRDQTQIVSGVKYDMLYMQNVNTWIVKIPGVYDVYVDLNKMQITFNLKN